MEIDGVNLVIDSSSDQNQKSTENQGSNKKRQYQSNTPYQKSFSNSNQYQNQNSSPQQGQNRNFNNSPLNKTQSYVQHQPGQNPNNNVQLQNQVPNTTLPHQAQNQTSTNSPYQQGHARNFYQQQPAQGQINNQQNNAGQQARTSQTFLQRDRPNNSTTDNPPASPQQNGIYQINKVKDQKPDINLKGVALLNNILLWNISVMEVLFGH